jgi:hypothetical protein
LRLVTRFHEEVYSDEKAKEASGLNKVGGLFFFWFWVLLLLLFFVGLFGADEYSGFVESGFLCDHDEVRRAVEEV